MAASMATQANQLDDVKKSGKLVCGTMSNIEPMGYLDPKTQTVVGLDVDICRAVAEGLGVKFEQQSLSLESRIPELQIGRIDILSAVLGYTKERAEQIAYSDSHFQVPIRIFVRSDAPFKKLADLNGHKVGSVTSSTPDYWLRRRFPEVQSVTFRDSPSVFLALQQGKVDGQGNTVTSGSRYVNGSNGKFRWIDETLGWEPNGLGIRKNEPEFLAAVNEVLKQMEASGKIDEIWNKWLGPQTLYGIAREKRLTPISEVSTDIAK